jgi:hypothetical protein
MNVGDLVKPLIACGGHPGNQRCTSAIILNIKNSHETVEVAMFEYETVEVYKYELACPCGVFEYNGDYLELIK